MLIVLPSLASKELPIVPPEMLIVLPSLASKELPTVPPEMLIVLPSLASKPLPTVPPKILTSVLVLELSRLPALNKDPTEPPSETFSWVSEEIPWLLPMELPENSLGFGLPGSSGRLMTVSNCA